MRDPATPPHRFVRRALRIAAAFGVVAVASVFAAKAAFLHYGADPQSLSALISKLSGVRVSVESTDVEWNWNRPELVVEGLSVDGGPSAKSARIAFAWQSLLALSPIVSELILVEPVVSVALSPDGTATVDGLPRRGGPFDFEKAAASFSDASAELVSATINLRASDGRFPAAPWTLSARARLTADALEAQARVEPPPWMGSDASFADAKLSVIRNARAAPSKWDGSLSFELSEIASASAATLLDSAKAAIHGSEGLFSASGAVLFSPKAPLKAALSSSARNLVLRTPGGTVSADSAEIAFSGGVAAGTASFKLANAGASIPRAFPQPLPAFGSAEAVFDWVRRGPRLDIAIANARAVAPFADAAVSGTLSIPDDGSGTVSDLHAEVARADPAFVWAFMPSTVGKDARLWLRQAFRGGNATATARLSGNLSKFPFKSPQDGVFGVFVSADDVSLNFHPQWPPLEHSKATILFKESRMEVELTDATILGARVAKSEAVIPDLGCDGCAKLLVAAHAKGPTPDFISALAKGTVPSSLKSFAAGAEVHGGASAIELGLDIPLSNAASSSVTLDATLAADKLRLFPDMPWMAGARISVAHGPSGTSITDGTARIFGAAGSFDGTVAPSGSFDFKLKLPRASIKLARDEYPWVPALVSGTAGVSVSIVGTASAYQVKAEVDAAAASIDLPAQLRKAAGTPSRVSVQFDSAPDRQELFASAPRYASFRAVRERSGNDWTPKAAVLSVGAADEPLPPSGLSVSMVDERFNLADWESFFSSAPAPGVAAAKAKAGSPWIPPLDRFSIRARRADLRKLRLDDLVLSGRLADSTSASFNIDSAQASGTVEWSVGASGSDRIKARLTALNLSKLANADAPSETAPPPEINPAALPEIDLQSTRAVWNGVEIGSILVSGGPDASGWTLREATLRSPSGTATVSGHWQAADGRTDAKLAASFDDAGSALSAAGFPQVLLGGSGSLSAELQWPGKPWEPTLKALSGTAALRLADGSVPAVDPGEFRLLSLLSLNALPRRLAFDFRDALAQGIPYDFVLVQARIDKGRFIFDRAELSGPLIDAKASGALRADGQADIALIARPIPGALGEALAVAANPALGAAAWLLQGAANPLGKVFEREYRIEGPLSDPSVKRIR